MVGSLWLNLYSYLYPMHLFEESMVSLLPTTEKLVEKKWLHIKSLSPSTHQIFSAYLDYTPISRKRHLLTNVSFKCPEYKYLPYICIPNSIIMRTSPTDSISKKLGIFLTLHRVIPSSPHPPHRLLYYHLTSILYFPS